MEEKDFADVVIASEILTSEELIDVMKYFNAVSSVVGFPEIERVGPLLLCCRFQGLARNVGKYGELKKEYIDLSVDKDIILHGIRMFGSEDSEYFVMLNIIEKQRKFPPVKRRSGKFSSGPIHVKLESFHYHGYNMFFDSPVDLKKDVKYRITAIIDGPYSSLGTGCYNSVQRHGVTFTFSKNEESDSICRQFAEFLFQQK